MCRSLTRSGSCHKCYCFFGSTFLLKMETQTLKESCQYPSNGSCSPLDVVHVPLAPKSETLATRPIIISVLTYTPSHPLAQEQNYSMVCAHFVPALQRQWPVVVPVCCLNLAKRQSKFRLQATMLRFSSSLYTFPLLFNTPQSSGDNSTAEGRMFTEGSYNIASSKVIALVVRGQSRQQNS